MTRFIPLVLSVLILAGFCGGCANLFGGGNAITNDTPARALVREAADVNLLCEASYTALDVAYRSGKVKPPTMVALKPYIDAIEAGRKELMKQAAAGNVSAADATKAAILAALSQVALAQLGVPITPLPTHPATLPSDVPSPPSDLPTPG